MSNRAPSYVGLVPASQQASAAARGASRKRDTKPELLLRKALWAKGCRYRKNVASLPGKPDIVFRGERIAVFCDGDFWHGKDWEERRGKLEQGTNATYWVAKIQRNMERDQENARRLEADGWTVLRFWESDIKNDLEGAVRVVLQALGRDPSRLEVTRADNRMRRR